MDDADVAMAEAGSDGSGGDQDMTDTVIENVGHLGIDVPINTIHLAGRRKALLRAHRLAQGTFTGDDYAELLNFQVGTDTLWSRTLAAAYRSSGQDVFTLETYVGTLPIGAELHSPSANFFTVLHDTRQTRPVFSPKYVVS